MENGAIELPDVRVLGIMDEDGKVVEGFAEHVDDEQVIAFYETMRLARRFDEKLLSLQRQGRVGTIALNKGQEAQIGATAALRDTDWLVPAYREYAALIQWGAPLHKLVLYNMGDERGGLFTEGKHTLPYCMEVAGHLPHAMGIGWGIKLRGDPHVALTFFGEGATSQGSFHEAANFAAVMRLPVVFVCLNNQYAISLHVRDQTASETIAQKAVAYGMHGIRVDGNDVLAVHRAATEAVERARKGDGPTLLECLTYRLADHTTSDDAGRYRAKEEQQEWEKKDPFLRVRNYLHRKGLWDEDKENALLEKIAKEIEDEVAIAEKMEPQPAGTMFSYMYDEETADLREQEERFRRDG